ncbi:hypothetical protein niasHT_027712 [Heterodera trifolii]|uniref:Uncharacterized protein n=1 Tax=Heterodera trifolii TaxID=157864 RepID=A0ABD2KBL0_9BILA
MLLIRDALLVIGGDMLFDRIQCFCFDEQILRPGETEDLPVFFYIDPEYVNNPPHSPPTLFSSPSPIWCCRLRSTRQNWPLLKNNGTGDSSKNVTMILVQEKRQLLEKA